MEAETRAMRPQAKECREPPEAGATGSWSAFLIRAKHSEGIYLCDVKPPGLWCSVTTAPGNKDGGVLILCRAGGPTSSGKETLTPRMRRMMLVEKGGRSQSPGCEGPAVLVLGCANLLKYSANHLTFLSVGVSSLKWSQISSLLLLFHQFLTQFQKF